MSKGFGGTSPVTPTIDKRGWGFRVAGPLIIICAALAVLVAADYWINSDKIYRGVQVGTINLGGKTPAEAEEIVRERTTGALREFQISGPEDFTFAAEEMGVDFKVEETVEAAYAVGREGGILERLTERARAAYGTVTIPPKADYRSDVARAEIENLAASLNEDPQEASMTVYGSEVEVTESHEGYEVDVPATIENVDAAVEDMTGEAELVGEVLEPEIVTREAEAAAEKARTAVSRQVVLSADGQRWTLSPADIGSVLEVTKNDGELKVRINEDLLNERLANVYAALTAEPVEADYAINGAEVSVVPGQAGKSVQSKKLLESMRDGLFDGKYVYEVPVVTVQPEFTTAEAEKLRPTDLLSSYRTNYLTYDDSPGRVKNLETSSGAVSGTMLAPGEVFSFNALAQQYEYEETKVIVEGRVDEAEGGGLCQVSSTLYMAANLAGLDVVERYPHYAELPYIRPGFDATVWFGALDMKFKNTSPGYILIQEWVDAEGYVNAQIFGQPSGIEVDMSSEKISTTEDEEGHPVTKWVTYQTVTQNGQVLYDGVLHTDTYKYLKPAEEDAPYDERPPN